MTSPVVDKSYVSFGLRSECIGKVNVCKADLDTGGGLVRPAYSRFFRFST